MGARQLAAHEGHLLLPRVRDQVDVLHVPGVVVGSDAGRPGAGRGALLQPDAEVLGCGARVGDGLVEIGAGAGNLLGVGVEVAGLTGEVADAGQPEIAGVGVGKVHTGLFQQRRDGADAGREFRRIRVRERVVVGPGIDPAVDHGAFMGRDVALRQEHDHVEGRIARPGTAHAVVEVEPVHLRAHQVPVDLFGDGPTLGGQGVQAQLPLRELGLLPGHGGGGVVRDAIHEFGHLEGPPLLEELHQVGVGSRAGGDGGVGGIRRTPHEEDSDHDERDRGDEGRGTKLAAGHDGLPDLWSSSNA